MHHTPLAYFQYDPLGNRERIVRGNGSATYYAYDPVSRLDQNYGDSLLNYGDSLLNALN